MMINDPSQFADDWVLAVVMQPGWGTPANDLEYMIASGVRDDLMREEDTTEPETVWESASHALFFFGRVMLFWYAVLGLGVSTLHAPVAEAETLANVMGVIAILYGLWCEVSALWQETA
jgi:sulfite exporter TauE/SafE